MVQATASTLSWVIRQLAPLARNSCDQQAPELCYILFNFFDDLNAHAAITSLDILLFGFSPVASRLSLCPVVSMPFFGGAMLCSCVRARLCVCVCLAGILCLSSIDHSDEFPIWRQGPVPFWLLKGRPL